MKHASLSVRNNPGRSPRTFSPSQSVWLGIILSFCTALDLLKLFHLAPVDQQ